MNENYLKAIFAFVAIPCTFVAVAKYLDEVFGSGTFAKKIARQFAEMRLTPYFSKAYGNAFDLPNFIYGVRVISLRSFCVSVLVAILWFAIQCLFIAIIDGENAWFFNSVFTPLVIKRLWQFILIGATIDFISLCATRWMLAYAINKSFLQQLFVLVADAILSIGIFFVLFSTTKNFILGDLSGRTFFSLGVLESWFNLPFNLQLTIQLLNDANVIPNGDGTSKLKNFNTVVVYAYPEGMLFISSLLTSIWIWLIIITQKIYGVAYQSNRFKNWMIKQSNIESKPILSVAMLIFILAIVPLTVIFTLLWSAFR